jgi:transcriptional regulator with PAS, ATPase and Fis domain
MSLVGETTTPLSVQIVDAEATLGIARSPRERAALSARLGQLFLLVGREERALLCFARARDLMRSLERQFELAEVTAWMGAACAVKGEHLSARRLMDEAEEFGALHKDGPLGARLAAFRADAWWRAGEMERARASWELVRERSERMALEVEQVLAYTGLGLVMAATEPSNAEAFAQKAVEQAAALGHALLKARSLIGLGRARCLTGDWLKAKPSIDEGMGLLIEMGVRRELADSYLEAGLALGQSRERGQEIPDDLPARWLAEAQRIYMESGRLTDLNQTRRAFRGLGRRSVDKLGDGDLETSDLRSVIELCSSLHRLPDPLNLPQAIARIAAQLTGADRVLVALTTGADAVLTPAASLQLEDDEEPWILLKRTLAEKWGASLWPNERAMTAPFYLGGRLLGGVYCDKRLSGGDLTPSELELLTVYTSLVATVVDNARIANELRMEVQLRETTLQSISDGVICVNPRGEILSINDAALRMFDLTRPAAPGFSLHGISELRFLTSSLKQEKEFEGRLTRLGGKEYLVNTRLIRDSEGVAGLIATLTEFRRAATLANKIFGSSARFSFSDMVGTSNPWRQQMRTAMLAARSESVVLITGSSGTGKELVAQAIHNGGPNSQGPYIAVNCAAIPRELLESELFGYEAGAFSGAKRTGQPGKFELAEGGTLLLDEIGEMPLEMQVKLLRVLQERRVARLGSRGDHAINARVIAATNRDLLTDVRAGRFREDLYYRLRVIVIDLPPLRERDNDIELLVEHFIRIFSARLGRRVRGASPEVMAALRAYPWPGNVRELEHVIESEVHLTSEDAELLTEIPHALLRSKPSATHEPRLEDSNTPVQKPLEEAMEDPEANTLHATTDQLFLSAMRSHRGKIPNVARELGVSRGTVYNRIKRLNVDVSKFRKPGEG